MLDPIQLLPFLADHRGRIDGLNVCIIGDVLHSRVARSNIWGLTKLGARVAVCAPRFVPC